MQQHGEASRSGRLVRCAERRQRIATSRGGSDVAGAETEFSPECAAETGSVGEAQVFADSKDRLSVEWIGQNRMRLKQALSLDVAHDPALIHEQPVEAGSGNPYQLAKDTGSEGRRSQMHKDRSPDAIEVEPIHV